MREKEIERGKKNFNEMGWTHFSTTAMLAKMDDKSRKRSEEDEKKWKMSTEKISHSHSNVINICQEPKAQQCPVSTTIVIIIGLTWILEHILDIIERHITKGRRTRRKTTLQNKLTT